MAIYGASETPRVLLQGISVDTPVVEAIRRYTGCVEEHGEAGVRWSSWDVVICQGRPQIPDDGQLRVIQIGGVPVGSVTQNQDAFVGGGGPSLPLPMHFKAFHPVPIRGIELVIPDELDDGWRDLVKSVLLPVVRETPLPRAGFVPWAVENFGSFTALITDLDGAALAMRYAPPEGPKECLYLPPSINDLEPWLAMAFREWSKQDPKTFPAEPDWLTDPHWMTVEEVAARSEVDASRAELEQALEWMQRRVADAEAALAHARTAADNGQRVLVTGTGEPLVAAVRAALERLGFVVRDMDAEGEREKREDLRVIDGDWIAICEIKGYGKGASTTDLLKIGRFETLFVQETGKLPDAKWYVVNQFRERPPSARQPMLKGQDGSVEEFASGNGLAIDSRELFQLDKAVAAGLLFKEAARELLRSAFGRFEFHLPTDSEGTQATPSFRE
ncbi:hypothetical protein [Nocardia sp. NPDC059239]|uniref:hypothetical protein n=1 Tax=unclassified Nocardia TaxID=2637762 RepID=UPI00368294D5